MKSSTRLTKLVIGQSPLHLKNGITQDTAALYFAEKAPNIEIEDVKLNGDTFDVTVKNVGESYARYVSANLEYPLLHENKDLGAIDQNMELAPHSRDILKGSVYKLSLTAPTGTLNSIFRINPLSIVLERDEEKEHAPPGIYIGGSLLLNVNYVDALKEPHTTTEILYLMHAPGTNPQKSAGRNIILREGGVRIVPVEGESESSASANVEAPR